MEKPTVICPQCKSKNDISKVLTAQSNQNIIFECLECGHMLRNIETNKG